MSNYKRKEVALDYKSFEQAYGIMFHLLIDLKDFSQEKIRFCSYHDKDKFLSVDGKPIFYTQTFGFRIAERYTIIFPKIYVISSSPLDDKYCIARNYLH